MRISVLIFICWLNPIFSQRFKPNYIDFSATVHPSDYFVGLGCSFQHDRWLNSIALQTGVNRSFFQKRLYPELYIGSMYQPMNRYHFVKCGWMAASRYWSVSSSSKSFQFDLQPAVQFSLGKLSCFRFTTTFGPTLEVTKSAENHSFVYYTFRGILTWSYAVD